MTYWVYILECIPKNISTKNKSIVYYVGSTGDLERRYSEHKNGQSRYTKNKLVKLVYCETLMNRSDAFRREIELKK